MDGEWRGEMESEKGRMSFERKHHRDPPLLKDLGAETPHPRIDHTCVLLENQVIVVRRGTCEDEGKVGCHIDVNLSVSQLELESLPG